MGVKNVTYILESIEYQKGAVIGRLLEEEFTQNGSSGKIVIFDKYQKFEKLKQGNSILLASFSVIHKKKFCIAKLINGEFIDSKGKISEIK